MPRCPVCGDRVPQDGRRCPIHGPVEPPEPPAIAVPGYRMVRLLGGGGFGQVFAAERHADGAQVAVKIAVGEEGAAARLEREATALSAIGWPDVPAFIETGRLGDGTGYLVMELVTAPTLAELMGTGRLGLAGLAAMGPAIARSVATAHAHGFAHLDLKPENIFIDGDRARLFDFGLMRALAAAQASPSLTRAGTLVGTAGYMAPEQCGLEGEPDARSDIYALGVIFYEMLTGSPPFRGSSAEVQHAHRRVRPRRPSELAPMSAAVEEVVLRCLAKEPARRFASAGELDQALRKALPAGDRIARTPPPATPTAGRSKRTMALLAVPSGDLTAAQKIVAPRGGVVAHLSADRTVFLFDADDGTGNPAHAAWGAASQLIAAGVCAGALLDLAPVTVVDGKHGRRYLSPRFELLEVGRASGLQATPAARAVLGDAFADQDRREATPLIGRDQVLGRLEELAALAALDGISVMTSVIAAPGYGKSRLGEELVARLGGRMEVVDLRARNPVEGDPQLLLRELTKRALDLPDQAPADGGLELLIERLGPGLGAQTWPEVALALGWIETEAPEIRRRAAAPGGLRAGTARAIGESLRRRARRRPLAVIVDDAQFADETSLDALEYASLAEAGAPLFVAALARPRFGDARPSWGERATRRERFSLGPLERAAGEALCRRLLLPAEDVPATAVDLLLARSQSIPLLLTELVRGLKREGLVKQRARGGRWYVAAEKLDRLPNLPVVEWLTQRELEALSPELAAHARLASLLGIDISAAEMDGVVQALGPAGAAEFPLDADVGLRRLAADGLLVPGPDGKLAFRHALVREAVAQATAPETRIRVHRAAWSHYRQVTGWPEDLRLAQLAYHAARAGLREPSRDAYFELAEHARARHAYVDAEMLYSRCIEHLERADDIADKAHHGRGRVRYRLARYEDALADLSQARELAHARGDLDSEMDLLLEEATALDWMGDFSSSAARVQEVASCSSGLMRPELEASLLLGLGRSQVRFSRDAEAYQLLRRAASIAETIGDAGYETFVVAGLMLGWMLPGLGRLDEAEAALAAVIDACTARDDRLHLMAALNNRAPVLGFRGDPAAMRADLERVLELAREVGQPTMELMAHFNLGEYQYLMGEVDAAAPHVERAVLLERRLVGDWGRPLAVILEARLRLAQGDVARARDIVRWIGDQQARARGQARSDALMVPSEAVLCDAVELATRSGSDEEWAAVETRSVEHSVGQERVEVLAIRARAARRAGRPETARSCLLRAIELCERVPNMMRAALAAELANIGTIQP